MLKYIKWFRKCKHKHILQGGGAHFGDDLLTCRECGLQKYPEVFPFSPWSKIET